jgi:hypothetical protein
LHFTQLVELLHPGLGLDEPLDDLAFPNSYGSQLIRILFFMYISDFAPIPSPMSASKNGFTTKLAADDRKLRETNGDHGRNSIGLTRDEAREWRTKLSTWKPRMAKIEKDYSGAA